MHDDFPVILLVVIISDVEKSVPLLVEKEMPKSGVCIVIYSGLVRHCVHRTKALFLFAVYNHNDFDTDTT